MKERLCWAVLGVLLAAALVGAATLDRKRWPAMVGDEAAYLMQAESLAWDLDLAYSAEDYRRFTAHWQLPPEGLILQSGDGGATITYGKPVFYSLYLAPFVRLSPTRGAAVANALLLALAGVVAALALKRQVGPGAPLWVAAFLFASVAFAYVFWAHADLFMMCLTALALSLAYGGGPAHGRATTQVYSGPTTEPTARVVLRWAAVGALLALVAVSRPFYATLLLPAALAVPAARRRTGLAALAGGVVAAAGLAVLLSLAVNGTWTSYGGERMGFYQRTGFPEIDFPREAWGEKLAERPGTGSWIEPEKLVVDVFDLRLLAYDVYYFLAGRFVGLLPYFLPLVLGFTAWRRGSGRWALLVAVAGTAALFFYYRPFNFYGGGGAIANRYFLPVYPALWFVAARPGKARWAPVVAALAGLALWPLWLAPRAYPFPQGQPRYASALAQRWLPYETTLSHLKPAGQEDLVQGGLWIKLLDPSLRPEAGGARLSLGPGTSGQLLVGSPQPLESLTLTAIPPAPARLEIDGAEIASTVLRPDGGADFILHASRPTAKHPMWWTQDDYYLYRLRLFAPGDLTAPLRFSLSLGAPPTRTEMRPPALTDL